MQYLAEGSRVFFPDSIKEYDNTELYEYVEGSYNKTIDYDAEKKMAYDIISRKYKKKQPLHELENKSTPMQNIYYTVSTKKINDKITARMNLKKFGDELTNPQGINQQDGDDEVYMNYNSEVFKSHKSQQFIKNNLINKTERIATLSKKDDKEYEKIVNNIKQTEKMEITDNMLYVETKNNIILNTQQKNIICRKCNGNHYTINCLIINIVADKPIELKKKIYMPRQKMLPDRSNTNNLETSNGNIIPLQQQSNMAVYISGFDEYTNYDDLREWISNTIGNDRFKLIYKIRKDNAIIKFGNEMVAQDAIAKLNKNKFHYTIILAEWAKIEI